ncbi:hypothetical protein OU994_24305 [Pseudoduganella sp. SL102]|uniref:hypothetical protein n=1 Tax=Pseudoduganella sp. SL102 TaxID=2995154 RepID=UPI00248C5281|nr:hypothetical protein [Pseudoduganella sp. SL102]WBS01374.1 hypothetical protein OU994_24305 [Pseudoduganella sp. SL102]
MRMKRWRCCAVVAGLAAAMAASAVPPKTERFLGTGRACYGALTITPGEMSWVTPFSRCEPVRFGIIEQGRGRTTYRMEQIASECRYQVVSLTHRTAEGPDMGWNAIGYPDELSYRQHKASGFSTNHPGTLACYVIRDPDPTGPLDW